GADFERGIQTMIDRLGAHPVPIQLPIGSEADFQGVIDLVTEKAIIYKDDLGQEWEVVEIPDRYKEAAHDARTALIEAIAEFADGALEESEVTKAQRKASDDEPFSALAFKVMSDPFVGKLTYFRVYSGKLQAGGRVLNATTGRTERIGRILMMHANTREEQEE